MEAQGNAMVLQLLQAGGHSERQRFVLIYDLPLVSSCLEVQPFIHSANK